MAKAKNVAENEDELPKSYPEKPVTHALISAYEAIVLGSGLDLNSIKKLEDDFAELRVGDAATFQAYLDRRGRDGFRDGFIARLAKRRLRDIEASARAIRKDEDAAKHDAQTIELAKNAFAELGFGSVEDVLKRVRSPKARAKLLAQFKDKAAADLAEAESVYAELVANYEKLDTAAERITGAIMGGMFCELDPSPDGLDAAKLFRQRRVKLTRAGRMHPDDAVAMNDWEGIVGLDKLMLWLRRTEVQQLFGLVVTKPAGTTPDTTAPAARPVDQSAFTSSGRVGPSALAAFAVLYLHQRHPSRKPLVGYRRTGLAKRLAEWASPQLQSVVADKIDERQLNEVINLALEIEKLPPPRRFS